MRATHWDEHRIRTDPHLRGLLDACPVLRHLVDRALRGEALDRDAIVVLQHTLGHLPEGPAIVNTLLRKIPGTTRQHRLTSRLGGNPTSCAKIRKRLGELTWRLDCDCDFEHAAADYPTPLLHLRHPAGGRARPVGLPSIDDERQVG